MSKRYTRHVLASLRERIGFSQEEFAALIGCSRSAVASLELANGRLGLSPKMAQTISGKTGVSVEWLLENKPGSTPIQPNGRPWTLDDFDRALSGANDNAATRPDCVHTAFALATSRIASVLLSSFRSGKFPVANHRLSRFLESFEAEFGSDSSVDSKDKSGATVSPQPPGTTDRLLKVALEKDDA
ncbi:MAG: helix-turn-helix transcriptional regulator [Verrucomicrobia bacterium]|nr:helix-turn-helix transcriptional regulator [Verrucomicrobiota bacterium]